MNRNSRQAVGLTKKTVVRGTFEFKKIPHVLLIVSNPCQHCHVGLAVSRRDQAMCVVPLNRSLARKH
jgi:hypothetical protein